MIPIELEGYGEWNPTVAGSWRTSTGPVALRLACLRRRRQFRRDPSAAAVGGLRQAFDPQDSKTLSRTGSRAVLQAYGENRLNVHNIGLSSGTVSVRGYRVSSPARMSGSRAGRFRCPSTRTAASSAKKSCRAAPTPWKSRSSMRKATVSCTCAISSSKRTTGSMSAWPTSRSRRAELRIDGPG